jgi:hypothetical protein
VNQTPSAIPAQEALQRALVGACYSPAEVSDLIQAFSAEVLAQAGTSLGELGYGSAAALLADTANVIATSVRDPKAKPQTMAHGLTAKEAAFRLIADTTTNPETAAQFRQAADKERADTFPAWLAHRMDPQGPDWDAMNDEDRTHWEHQARAVRRAVARDGFKAEAGA